MTKPYKIEIIESNIVLLTYHDGVKSDLTMEKQIMRETLDLTLGGQYHSIVCFDNMMGSMTKEAQDFSANDDEWVRLRLSEALYTNSFTVSIIIGAYLKIHKPKVKTKAFSNHEKAFEWTLKEKSRLEKAVKA